ncbi:phosphatase PAP2 family protein [Actinoallomurus sp. CA-150999]|uniref:phosphatase PAP2 family protein n=1 Tax=Actinoallomurus sp. CA-150999 TaxID=3239887 RepID=UPI003D8F29F4
MSLLNRARELDKRAFGAVAAAELPGLEYILPRLSRIANHSVLWGGVAGGLALTRQPRLRRAALRGVIAIGLASPLANLVGKQAFRRPRPLIELFTPSARPVVTRVGVTLIPSIRSPWRLPTSPSFPSGHSASAAAFATGISLEAPAAVAVPVGITAAAVAFSRIYTGAHYPGDVLAGVALGTAAGLGTRLLWPTMPRSASARWVVPAEAVPGVALDHDLPLLVVPGGTLNHFARALGIHTVADAVAAYRSGRVARVDVGRAGTVTVTKQAAALAVFVPSRTATG